MYETMIQRVFIILEEMFALEILNVVSKIMFCSSDGVFVSFILGSCIWTFPRSVSSESTQNLFALGVYHGKSTQIYKD